MAKDKTYTLVLTVEGTLSDEAKEELAEAMASEASSVLCDLRGGDSGGVKVDFV